MTTGSTPDWRLHGVRIVRSDELDLNTPQTPGMTRAAAITHASAGANKLWAGTVTIHPNAKTGPHHHGKLESVIYVISGRARMRWGERLELLPKLGRATLSMCRRSFPIRRLMRAGTNRWPALSCVMIRRPSLLTSIYSRWSRRRRHPGLTLSIRIPKRVFGFRPAGLIVGDRCCASAGRRERIAKLTAPTSPVIATRGHTSHGKPNALIGCPNLGGGVVQGGLADRLAEAACAVGL